jgi:1,3-beta-glucan synthase
MATGHEQHEPVRQDATDCALLALLGRGRPGSLHPRVLVPYFKCTDDYYRSPECQNRVQPVKESLSLHTVIKPLYRFIRDQGYEVVDGRFVRGEKDQHYRLRRCQPIVLVP